MAKGPKKSPKEKRAQTEAQRKEWTQEQIDQAIRDNGGTPKDQGAGDDEEETSNPVGRPRLLSPSDWERIESLAAGGLTKIEIAESMGVAYRTLRDYELEFPQFAQAIARGREKSIERVENSMHKIANGYTMVEERIFYDSQVGKVVRAPTLKTFQPDFKAQHTILQHKETGSWRPKSDVEVKFPEPLVLKSSTGKPIESLGLEKTP